MNEKLASAQALCRSTHENGPPTPTTLTLTMHVEPREDLDALIYGCLSGIETLVHLKYSSQENAPSTTISDPTPDRVLTPSAADRVKGVLLKDRLELLPVLEGMKMSVNAG